MVLIRLRGYAGWSAPLLFANPEDRFSRVVAQLCTLDNFSHDDTLLNVACDNFSHDDTLLNVACDTYPISL